MTDKELLECAAKATGITVNQWHLDEFGWVAWIEPDDKQWNPIEDDGDALRLAVKLKMVIDTDWNGGANAGNACVDFPDPEYGYQEGNGKSDPYAATRRAIVRAAAEIGKGVK